MVKKYSFIDENRIAASGVSYGGYVVGMMMAESNDASYAPIRCGIAVCPVVEWRYYGKSNITRVDRILISAGRSRILFKQIKLKVI